MNAHHEGTDGTGVMVNTGNGDFYENGDPILVLLKGTFPAWPNDGRGNDFEIGYFYRDAVAAIDAGDDFEPAMMSQLAHTVMLRNPPGTVVHVAGRPPMIFDYRDPLSLWAVFAYAGAAFEEVDGIAADEIDLVRTMPEPPPHSEHLVY
jgi:hypothetical protein